MLCRGDDEEDEEEALPSSFAQASRGPPGTWTSSVRIIDVLKGRTKLTIPLDPDVAACSLACVEFADRAGDVYVAVGTSTSMKLKPRSAASSAILLYRFNKEGTQLEFIHR